MADSYGPRGFLVEHLELDLCEISSQLDKLYEGRGLSKEMAYAKENSDLKNHAHTHLHARFTL